MLVCFSAFGISGLAPLLPFKIQESVRMDLLEDIFPDILRIIVFQEVEHDLFVIFACYYHFFHMASSLVMVSLSIFLALNKYTLTWLWLRPVISSISL